MGSEIISCGELKDPALLEWRVPPGTPQAIAEAGWSGVSGPHLLSWLTFGLFFPRTVENPVRPRLRWPLRCSHGNVCVLHPSLVAEGWGSPGQMLSFKVCPLPLGPDQSLHCFFKVKSSSNTARRVLLACRKAGPGRESCRCLPWQHVTFTSVLSVEAVVLL